MSETQQSPQDHLTNIPTNVRHFMWNDDYIELLSQKLNLQMVKKLVDIGSGLGGLPGLFGLYMKPGSTVYGYDLDPEAVRQAQAFASAHPYSVKFEFAVASGHRPAGALARPRPPARAGRDDPRGAPRRPRGDLRAQQPGPVSGWRQRGG
jgi:hypothetical protein